MTQEHPITPPPELVEQWLNAPRYAKPPKDGTFVVQKCHSLSESEVIALVENAARWGADQELEACCKWVTIDQGSALYGEQLREYRRPKPLSLKEQALALIDECTDPHSDYLDDNALATIRRALEALPD